MNFVNLKLLVVCDNIENHVKVLKGFQRYHLKIVSEEILCAIFYQKPLTYLRKIPPLQVILVWINQVITSENGEKLIINETLKNLAADWK